MRVDTLTVGMFQSNAYVVSCEDTREAVLIDAGDEGERIIDHINDEGLKLKMVIATHGHIDHVSALAPDEAGHLPRLVAGVIGIADGPDVPGLASLHIDEHVIRTSPEMLADRTAETSIVLGGESDPTIGSCGSLSPPRTIERAS